MKKLRVTYNGESYTCRLSPCGASVIISNIEEGELRIVFGYSGEDVQNGECLISRLSVGDHIKIQVVEDDCKLSLGANLDRMYLDEYYMLKNMLDM